MANNVKWLLALLLVVVVWVLYLSQTDSGPEAEVNTALLPQWQNDDALLQSFDRVVLSQGGERLELVRTGEQWALNGGFYADRTPLYQVLSDLKAAQILERKTALAKNHEQLGLADSGLKVEVFNDVGMQAAVHVGKVVNGSAQFVRLADQDQTYTVGAFTPIRFDANSWRLKTVLDVAPERILKAEFKPAEGDVFAVMRDLGTQQLVWIGLTEDEQLKENAYLDQLLSGLSKLLIEEAVPKALDESTVVTQINYDLVDGAQIQLGLHRLQDADWLTIASSVYPEYANWQFKVAEYKAKALNRQAQEFIESKTEASATTETADD